MNSARNAALLPSPPLRGDALFHRCLAASGLAGGLFLLAVLLAPLPLEMARIAADAAPRLARISFTHEAPLPTPLGGTPGAAAGLGGDGPPEGTGPRGPLASRLGPGTGVPGPGGGKAASPGLGTGEAGRARALQVAAQLGGVTNALQGDLGGPVSAGAPPAGGARSGVALARRMASVGSARADAELAGAVPAIGQGAGGGADLGGSAVGRATVAVGSLVGGVGGDPRGGGGPGHGGAGGGGGMGGGDGGGVGSGVGMGNGGEGGGGLGGNGLAAGGGGGGAGGGPGGGGVAGPGVYRSNASLMAVIQRYSAGIQFCYSNELKHHDGLRGKLVVGLVVDAAGEVTSAQVVQNTLASSSLASCALSQIRDWRFPAIATGVTAFQVPFVFTPPR